MGWEWRRSKLFSSRRTYENVVLYFQWRGEIRQFYKFHASAYVIIPLKQIVCPKVYGLWIARRLGEKLPLDFVVRVLMCGCWSNGHWCVSRGYLMYLVLGVDWCAGWGSLLMCFWWVFLACFLMCPLIFNKRNEMSYWHMNSIYLIILRNRQLSCNPSDRYVFYFR